MEHRIHAITQLYGWSCLAASRDANLLKTVVPKPPIPPISRISASQYFSMQFLL